MTLMKLLKSIKRQCVSKYKILTSKKYRSQYKKHSLKDKDLIDEIVYKLANDIELDKSKCDHQLTGKYSGYKECHVKPGLLLVYRKDGDVLELYLVNVGSHSDIF